MSTPYVPAPMDVSRVQLDPNLLGLVELLARNTHEVWAHRRMAEGWRHGPFRSDERMEHPGLVPYEELSEAEKEYDRATALDALRVIIALGGSVTPPSTD